MIQGESSLAHTTQASDDIAIIESRHVESLQASFKILEGYPSATKVELTRCLLLSSLHPSFELS